MDVPQESRETQQVGEQEREALHQEHYTYSVLTVGTELAVLSPESSVRKRIFSYGKFFKEMKVILMSGQTGQGDVREGNVTVYPTNSSSKLARYQDALTIGRQLTSVDIVSTQDPFEVGYISYKLARHHKAPLHVQVHTDFLTPEYSAHSLVNAIRVLIAGYVIKRAKHVRVVSQAIADKVTEKYGKKVSVAVLPIFVDVQRFAATAAPVTLSQRFRTFSKRVLVVSRFEPEKNVSLAIRSFAESSPIDACLIILGQGSEYTVLERLVTKLGLDTRVFFEGFQDPAPYYALADILLVPSVYEGYGQVIIEALAAKKPVLSTDVGIAAISGAIITTQKEFSASLKQWFENGPKTGTLTNYPYASLEDYVEKYCADIAQVKEKTAT